MAKIVMTFSESILRSIIHTPPRVDPVLINVNYPDLCVRNARLFLYGLS